MLQVQALRSPLMDEQVSHYGVTQVFPSDSVLARHLENLFYLGYTVVENALSATEVAAIAEAIDRVYAEQMNELGGEDQADKIKDANHIRCPLAYDVVFEKLALHSTMLDLMKGLMGHNMVLMMQNAVINTPGDKFYQTHWHRDLNYQHWTSSQVLCANALFCIDDFTLETGGTYVLPGTHLREPFPSDAFVRANQQVLQAPAGSMVVMNGMMYHRAGKNTSTRVRRAVNHVIGLPFMAQQIDIPAFVGERLAKDDFTRNYFGYRWRPAVSAKDWRAAKIASQKA